MNVAVKAIKIEFDPFSFNRVEFDAVATNVGKYLTASDVAIKAKDGDFFIADWLRNRNTVEFLGIWEKVHNPDFNYGEYVTIRNQAGLNSYKISVKEWVAKTNAQSDSHSPNGAAA